MPVRPATPDDPDTLLAVPLDPCVGGLPPERVREELAAGRVRWPWCLLAVTDDGATVGRAVWWGRADSPAPLALDCLQVLDGPHDRSTVAAELLRHGHRTLTPGARPPGYQLSLDPGWRDDPGAVAAVEWRVRAAAAAGLGDRLERLQLEWTPAAGLPASTGRTLFRPGDDDEFLDVFARTAVGTLDVTTRRALTALGPAAQARDDLDFYRSCPGERDWWRIATTPAGEVTGFVVPSATPYARNVGYLGVLPEHRGRGLVDDLVAEATRRHAAAGAERVTATTDTTNTPTAAAFHRAGYRVTEVRLLLEAAPG